MENDLPKYHETFGPILEVLSDGKPMTYSDLRREVRDRFFGDLNPELYELKTKAGDQLILNRIGWGKAYLKQAKMVEQPERSIVTITEKGKSALKNKKVSLDDIVNDHDFLNHRKTQQVKSNIERGESSGASPQDLIDLGISELEEAVTSELLERLRSMDPYIFEVVVLKLLEAMGYGDFVATAKSGDGGIDGVINQDQLGLEKIYVQSKRYAEDNAVRETHIRNFIGAMSRDTEKGIFVTTSSFHSSAVEKAKDATQKIILIDGEYLVSLMYKYSVGVQTKNTYLLKVIDEDFFSGEV